MKTQFADLKSFASQLQADAAEKEDFAVHTSLLTVEPHRPSKLYVDNKGGPSQTFEMTEHFRRQLYTRLGIPQLYAERMAKEAPDLHADTLKTWWQKDGGELRTIRTLRGKARAYLSDRYGIIDNNQIAEHMLPVLAQIQGAEFHSLAITDERMHIKVIAPRIQGEVTPGDVVQLGLSVTNSEIGSGAFKAEPILLRLVCKNGMVREDDAFSARHMGRRIEKGGRDLNAAWKLDTQRAESLATVLRGRDIVNAMLTPATLESFLRPMREARGIQIVSPTDAIERVAKLGNLSQVESDGVLAHLVNGGDLSAYGLANAVTRYAQDVEDYTKSDQLERLGWKVLTLPRSEYKEFAKAA